WKNTFWSLYIRIGFCDAGREADAATGNGDRPHYTNLENRLWPDTTRRLYFACYLQAPTVPGRHGRLRRKTLRCRGSRIRETSAMTRQPFAAFAFIAAGLATALPAAADTLVVCSEASPDFL